MANRKKAEKKEKSSSQGKVEVKEEEKKEVHFCKECKWYDKSTEREFHRKVGPKTKKAKEQRLLKLELFAGTKKQTLTITWL